jgi:hypothetical protein
MLTLEQAKKIIGETDLSDKEIIQIRDDLHYLVEAIFEVRQIKSILKYNENNNLATN